MEKIYKLHDDNGLRDMTSAERKEYDDGLKDYNDRLFGIDLKYLRNKRNRLLSECDWIELVNAPLTADKKSKWQTYRTTLRNLTNGLDTVDKVNNVTWPTKP